MQLHHGHGDATAARALAQIMRRSTAPAFHPNPPMNSIASNPFLRPVRLTVLAGILLSAGAPSGLRADLTDNLLTWWDFEGGFADASGNNRHLTLADNPSVAPNGLPTIGGGGVGGSLAMHTAAVVDSFPFGTPPHWSAVPVPTGLARYGNGQIDALDFESPPGGFTVQAWINVQQLELAQTILFNRDVFTNSGYNPNGWELHLSARNTGNDQNAGKNNLVFFSRSGAGHESVGQHVTLSEGTWHHIVYTAGIGGGTLYLDGSMVGNAPSPSMLIGSPHDLYLGVGDATVFGIPDLKVNPLHGMMDDVALWNRQLSAAEVETLYGNGSGLNSPTTPGVPDSGSTLVLFLGALAGLIARRSRSAA